MDAKAGTGAARITAEHHGARLDAALAPLLHLLLRQPEPSPNGTAPTSPLLPPDAGLRARRRLWQTHAVLLDGRPAQPGTRVRAGQQVELRPLAAAQPVTQAAAPDVAPDASPDAGSNTLADAGRGNAIGNGHDAPCVLAEADGLVALYKPGGLHSAAIAGSAAPCVEALLPVLLHRPDRPAATASTPLPGTDTTAGFPRLLNRLDGPTSGILLAARTPQAMDRFHRAEDSGQAAKTYLALVHGVLDHPVTVRCALDTANRATTRVLPQDTPDPLRHTEITPLGVMQGTGIPDAAPCPPHLADDAGLSPVACSPAPPCLPDTACTPGSACTLVRCVIRKGARHQIRAHLAAQGHPIVGDARYGGTVAAGQQSPAAGQPAPLPGPQAGQYPAAPTLFLHHARIVLPGLAVACPPPWLHLLPQELQEAARTAYRLDS